MHVSVRCVYNSLDYRTHAQHNMSRLVPSASRRSSLYITYAYTPRRTRKIKQTPCQAPLNLPRTYEPNTNPCPNHTRPWQHHTLSHHSRCSQARPFCLHCDSSPRLINALCLFVLTLLSSPSRVNTLTHPPQKPLNRFLLLSLNRVQSSPPHPHTRQSSTYRSAT